MSTRFRTTTRQAAGGKRVRLYRGIAIPDSCRDTWEEYLWMKGVDDAFRRGFWRMRAASIAAWWKSGELVDVTATVRGRWMRVALVIGTAPGSHMGFWRTDLGALHGWNYRIGSVRRCITVLAHTRKVAGRGE